MKTPGGSGSTGRFVRDFAPGASVHPRDPVKAGWSRSRNGEMWSIVYRCIPRAKYIEYTNRHRPPPRSSLHWASRPPSARPATGNASVHKAELTTLLNEASGSPRSPRWHSSYAFFGSETHESPFRIGEATPSF
jgi:hypothetical protein